MKAIIYENGTKYASPVLAIKKAGWRTEVLVFNQERTRIRRVKMWKPERRVFIVDSGDFDCKVRGWEGCADVLEDDALQKAVRFGKTADIENFPQFKKYAEEITLAEWFEIEDERDIRSLMDVALGFHDSIPMRITAENADTEIEFDTTWNCTITLKFERVTASEFIDRIGIIYDSTLEKTADGFIWKVDCFDPGRVGGTVDLLPCSKEPYIVCGGIKWSIEPGKNTNSAKIKTYDDLYDFYCDLKTVSKNVFIEGDKLIARHKNDTLAIEKRPNGYITYLNGKREKGLWEDGDDCPEDWIGRVKYARFYMCGTEETDCIPYEVRYLTAAEELVLGYDADPEHDQTLCDGISYKRMYEDLRTQYNADSRRHSEEIARLMTEIATLKDYIAMQKDLIGTKDEIISMLKKLGGGK